MTKEEVWNAAIALLEEYWEWNPDPEDNGDTFEELDEEEQNAVGVQTLHKLKRPRVPIGGI
jgi:hypothetical protein